MTENKKSTNNNLKLLILLLSACALLVAIAVISVVTVLPLLSYDHIKNTADALFFDLSPIGEIMGGNALELSAELDLPEKLTGLEGDLHLAVNSAADQSTKSGNGGLTLGLGENSISLNIVYDAETVALGGLRADPNGYISLPRKNIKEAFDNSLFFYGSGSIHSMSMSNYSSIVSSLESLLAPERDDTETLKNTLKEIAAIAEPQSSFLSSEGKLCRKITFTLDKTDIEEIVDILTDEDEQNAQLQALTEAIGNNVITLSYITDGKYITSAQVSSDNFNADIDIICDGDAVGFKADTKYTYAESTVSDISITSEYEITYRKRETDSEITIELKVTPKHVNSTDLFFTLNKTDSSYALKSNEKDIASGIFELDGEKLRFSVIDSENAQTLVSFLLERPDSIVSEMPAHTPLLDMDKDELTDFFRNVPIKTASDLLKTTVGLDLSAYMTADGKLMLHADKLMTEAEKSYASYVSMLKTTDRKIIDTVSKIYLWNDRLDAYILFTYAVKEDSLTLGCAYELTDEILAEYHVATIGETRIMTVHDLEKTVNIPAECENAGKEVYNCKYCDYGYEKDFEPLGHKRVTTTARTYIHDGSFKVGSYSKCERCNLYLSASANLYCYYTLAPNSSGGYTIVTYEQQHPYVQGHFFVPLPADVDFSITEIRLSLKYNVSSAFFPEGIKKISANSFPITSRFKILILRSTLTEIEDGAFYGGGKPRKIFYSGTKEAWEKINLGEYATLWSDVEIVFCPDGVKYDDYKNELN